MKDPNKVKHRKLSEGATRLNLVLMDKFQKLIIKIVYAIHKGWIESI